jgi:hypothetical protein
MDGFPNADADRGGPHSLSDRPSAADGTLLYKPPAMESACCCSARPVVTVVMPTTAERAATDLLMCGHHFDRSREVLQAAGAAAYDSDGLLIMPHAWEHDMDQLLSDSSL